MNFRNLTSNADRSFRCFAVIGLFFGVFAVGSQWACGAPPQPEMRLQKTANGTRFGLFGPIPESPAPTIFVLAGSLETMDKSRIYSEAGRQLSEKGWLYVTVDLPCHGLDAREGEPAQLSGWAHRVKQGEDFTAPFLKRAADVLDHLITRKLADPERIAACGTSRGGFCALRLAAADSRVRAVTCVSPVTNLLALREFEGVTAEQADPHSALAFAEKLAGRSIWLSISNADQRVGTDDCIAVARRLVEKSLAADPMLKKVPVELIVGPGVGHHAVENAYTLAAEFVARQLPPQ